MRHSTEVVKEHDSIKIMTRYYCMVIVLALCVPSCTFQHERIRTIDLGPGVTPLQIEDRLEGIHDEREFVFRAHAGMRVTIELSAPGGIRRVLVYPSGKREGGPGGGTFTHELPETGEYRLRVTESPMGESWQGSFKIRVELVR